MIKYFLQGEYTVDGLNGLLRELDPGYDEAWSAEIRRSRERMLKRRPLVTSTARDREPAC